MQIGKILKWLAYSGMIILLGGLIMYLNDMSQAFYLYIVGVIPILVSRIYEAVNDNENKRKHVIFVFSGLLLASAAVGIYLNSTWWIVPIAIAATLDLYISFRFK